MTPAGRRRLSAALKKRWAAKKAAESAPPASPQKPARHEARFAPEGRKQLADAMRRRWAVNFDNMANRTEPRTVREWIRYIVVAVVALWLVVWMLRISGINIL
jgi:hypothetical protein